MNNNFIEKSIHDAFNHAKPDNFGAILSACQDQKGTVLPMNTNQNTPKNKNLKYIVAAAAVVAVVVAGGMLTSIFSSKKVAAQISLDVNPSIEIQLNKYEKVVNMSALNDDGEKILAQLDVINQPLETALNTVVDAMVAEGYLTENSNSILVTVDASATSMNSQLKDKISTVVNANLENAHISGAVMTQTKMAQNNISDLANQYGITTGKAQLIEKIIQTNSLYQFEDLVGLSINDLNLLITSDKNAPSDITVTGAVSDKKYIGKEKALDIALKSMNLTQSQVTGLQVEMDCERNTMVYEVEFVHSRTEYDYMIHATTGEVLNVKKEAVDSDDLTDADDLDHDDQDDDSPVSGTVTIEQSKALEIALNHAGVAKEKAMDVKIELDTENKKTVYEIEFDGDTAEYDYKIDATSGAVLFHKKELKDTASSNTTQFITQEKALSIALNHAGVSQSQALEIKVELDQNALSTIYEVDFKCAPYEYEYQIDAVSGTIQQSHKEKDD